MGPLPFPLESREALVRPRLSIVIPAFNEQAALPRTAAALTEALDALNVDWTVLFVNDGSRDDSAAVLQQLHRRDRRFGYILLSRNFGHQAALTAGLDHAEGDVVVTMDADLQHPPNMLVQMLAAWREGYDVVHTRKLATSGLSGWRRVTTELAYRLIRRVASISIIPQSSDFRLLDVRVLSALREVPEVARLHRGLSVWIGFRQCVLPFHAPERSAGESQYSLRQLITLMARSVFDYSVVFLQTGLIAGSIGFFLSTLWFLILLIRSLVGDGSTASGLQTAFVLLMTATVLVFVGIIGVYIARIYREVRRRPPYVIAVAKMPERNT